jgi:hypothetical protein
VRGDVRQTGSHGRVKYPEVRLVRHFEVPRAWLWSGPRIPFKTGSCCEPVFWIRARVRPILHATLQRRSIFLSQSVTDSLTFPFGGAYPDPPLYATSGVIRVVESKAARLRDPRPILVDFLKGRRSVCELR